MDGALSTPGPASVVETPDSRSPISWLALGIALLSVFFLRVWQADQPIWEGYIGRQVPTAMVARNLMRDGDFLHPKVDTGPFPNWFLVEPPVMAGTTALIARATGLPLGVAGRFLSALAMTLASGSLFGLVRRYEGGTTAFAALFLFSLFPVSIRYGRALQPDALMVGLSLFGFWLWTERRYRFAVTILAIAFATKVTGAFILLPLVCAPVPGQGLRKWQRVGLAMLSLVPAALWYIHAGRLIAGSEAQASASAGIAANWWHRLSSLTDAAWLTVVRDLTLRAFTPVGFGLFVMGWANWKRLQRVWQVWALAVLGAFLVLAGKLHHEYYWLMAAPMFAALGAIGWKRVTWPCVRVGVLVAFAAVAVFQSRTTWSTPEEWRPLNAAASAVAARTKPDAILIAPESMIYAADRRGCRFEWEPKAVVRAAREWPSPTAREVKEASDLIQFYVVHGGATHFADLQVEPIAPERQQLHAFLREQTGNQVLIDQTGGLLLIRLAGQGTP